MNTQFIQRSGIKRTAIVLVCLALAFSTYFIVFSSASVSAEEPTVITTAEELDEIRYDMEGDYVLGKDIDLDVPPYNTGAGWDPIGGGTLGTFKGTFDGKGHTISGLMIDGDRSGSGLFGYVASDTSFSNVTLENVNVKGVMNTGALVGELSHYSLIENVSVTGTVTGVGKVGGIVGWLINSEVKDSKANVHVSGGNSHNSNVGGLVGTGGEIINSTSAGTVESFGENVGGLAGNTSHIEDSSSTANVISHFTSSHNVENSNAGGLVGIGGKIINSHATGNVEGINDNVGGLAGYVSSASKNQILNSYSTGTVTGVDRIGGLIGHFEGSLIKDSSATGEVNGENNAGGLVGLQESKNTTVQKSFAAGKVVATGDNAGGLVGQLTTQAKIQDAYARGAVTGENNVGGLVGDNKASIIERSYATGEVTGQSETGGLVGYDLNGKYSNGAPNFYDSQTTGQFDEKGDTEGHLTETMQTRATFKNWNFTSTWKLNANDYPILRDKAFDTLTDVPSGYWGRDDITEIVENDIMKGSADPQTSGKFLFKPAEDITRAEFAVVIINALGEETAGTATGFADDGKIPAWAKEEVAKAKEMKIVEGDTNGNFNPTDKISRAEIATMIARAYDLEASQGGNLNFADSSTIPSWAKAEIEAVVESEIMQGQDKAGKLYFAPSSQAQRVEAGLSALRAYKLD